MPRSFAPRQAPPSATLAGGRSPIPVLYVCYLEADEPLVATQVVAYLRGLANSGFAPHLLTFEKQAHTTASRSEIAARLLTAGIRWQSLRYHKRPSLPATLFDIAQGTWAARRICRKRSIRLVHGRSHVGAAIAALTTAGWQVPYVFDVRGLLADEYVDSGNWRSGGLKFRLTKQAERHLMRRADGLVLLTRTVTDDLRREGLLSPEAKVEVIPCCADVAAFRRAAEMREEERRRRGWDADTKVFLYGGKLGGWYLVGEMARFFATAHRLNRACRLQVLTQSDPQSLIDALSRVGVPPAAYSIERSAPAETPRIMVAADAGLSLIRPCSSKRSSSPTKIGEYLAAGLPVVTTPGIGDCDAIFGSGELGVILRGFDEDALTAAVARLFDLMDTQTSERCRSYAERELALATVGVPRYERLYRRVLPAEETVVR